MKTIDFLVEELPKRGGWPDGAIGAGFLSGEGTLYFWDKNNDCPPKWTIDTDIEVEDGDEEVTREQYEAALAAKNDGWIEWGGGECPVPCGTAVDVKHRCGAVSENQQAWPKRHKESDVIVNPLSNAGQAFWRHENSVMDIIAYRLHKPQQTERPEASEEDLNECIGQAPASAWNGEGFPPVGCECEYSLNGGKTWWKCKVDCIVGTQGVVMLCDTFEGVQYVQFSSYGNALKFRPIRSEAERKRDAAVEAIDWYMPEFITDTPNEYYHAKKIYDAIAAGKIPGVKLED